MNLINRSDNGKRATFARIVPVGIVTVGLGLTAVLGAVPSGATTSKSSAAVVKMSKVGKVGTVLVTTKGITLYRYTPDKANKVECTGGCATAWPPLTVAAGATPTGVSGLGTIKDANGKLQVTFKGHPLYTFAGDKKSGTANGQGSEGTWFVVSNSVAKLTATAAATTAAASTKSTTSTGSSSSSSSTSAGSSSTATTTAPTSAGGYGY